MRALSIALLVSFLSPVLSAQSADIPLTNWTVRPYTRSTLGGITTMTDVTSPRVFIGVQPCRVADTRGNGAPIQGGIFANSEARNWTVTGICGIPAGADALSVNFTVTGSPSTIPAGAFLLAWPTGQPAPPTAVMTYGPQQTISNAAIVPLNVSGQMTVNVSHSTHVVLDVNGYFSDTSGNPANYLTLTNDSSTWTLNTENVSTTCTGACGILGVTNSGDAVVGQTLESNGDEDYGVYGLASNSNVNGAGVRGHAFNSAASGGYFTNGAPGGSEGHLATFVGQRRTFVYTGDDIIGGALAISGSKMFISPHPEDPRLEIRYASVEAPSVDVYFRGTAALVNGHARVAIPDHFRLTAREGTYMTVVTPLDRAVALRVEQEGPQGIVVHGTGDTRFHYVVYAERAEIEGFEPVTRNVLFTPEALEKRGGPEKLLDSTRALLVRNGTLNSDGSYNLETAQVQGWTIPERPVRPVPQQP